MKNGAFGVFLFFYYNQVLALSGTLAGLAVGIALVFDAISDPMAGSISDNWRSKLGRRHPVHVPGGSSLWRWPFSCFSIRRRTWARLGLFAWLLTFAVLTRGRHDAVPRAAHRPRARSLPEDFEERTTVVAFRQFFSTFGTLAAYIIGFIAVLLLHSPDHAAEVSSGWTPTHPSR